MLLSYVFRYRLLGAFLDASFPTFDLKWLPEKSGAKWSRRLLGTPGPQRRHKGLPKSSSPPRPFSNRMPDAGLDAHPMAPNAIRGIILGKCVLDFGRVLQSLNTIVLRCFRNKCRRPSPQVPKVPQPLAPKVAATRFPKRLLGTLACFLSRCG